MSQEKSNPMQISLSIFLVIVLVSDILTVGYTNKKEYMRGFTDAKYEDISLIQEAQQQVTDSLSADSVQFFINHSEIPTDVK